MWLTNASSREYNTLFWAPWHPNTHVYTDTYTYIHTHYMYMGLRADWPGSYLPHYL